MTTTHSSLFQHFVSRLGDDPEIQNPWIEKYFRGAIQGDVESACSLANSLKYSSALVVTWFKYKLYRCQVTPEVFGAVLRSTYQLGKIFGGFRTLGIPTREVVEMFDAAGPHAMTPEDIAVLQELPEEIPVFRGCVGSARAAQHSLSWTIKRAAGEEFASVHATYDLEHNREGILYSGVVKKAGVLAYLGDRGEYEVVCRPLAVKNVIRLTVLNEPRAGDHGDT